MLVVMAGYLAYSYYSALFAKSSGTSVDIEEVEPVDAPATSPLLDVTTVLLGVVGLGAGGYLMVDSAVSMADRIGLSALVVGITIVAFGTSLPELATSAVSAYRGETDIAVGNVIGSNLFNVLLVLGLVATISPLDVESQVMTLDIWVMLGVSIAL